MTHSHGPVFRNVPRDITGGELPLDALDDDLDRSSFEAVQIIEVKMRGGRRLVSGQPAQMVSERGKTLSVTSNYGRVIVRASGQRRSGFPFEFHVSQRTVSQTQPKEDRCLAWPSVQQCHPDGMRRFLR
jgi:hypothetical protein